MSDFARDSLPLLRDFRDSWSGSADQAMAVEVRRVYRAKDISPAQVAATGRRPGEYYVVREVPVLPRD